MHAATARFPNCNMEGGIDSGRAEEPQHDEEHAVEGGEDPLEEQDDSETEEEDLILVAPESEHDEEDDSLNLPEAAPETPNQAPGPSKVVTNSSSRGGSSSSHISGSKKRAKPWGMASAEETASIREQLRKSQDTGRSPLLQDLTFQNQILGAFQQAQRENAEWADQTQKIMAKLGNALEKLVDKL